jgi:hypothetical protein
MIKASLIRILSFLLLTIILLSQVLLQSGCANIVPPSGGERDSLPPILVKANPVNKTKNFTESHITLTFNEYVDIDNYQQNMVISPVPDNFPSLNRKLNVVTIKLRDTLEPNTTYSLNFGKTIRDVNEANIMKDFTYVFSTGSYIDSMQLSGKVLLAQTGAVDTTLTIMLHTTNEDSAVQKKKPRYITRTDAKGNFLFKNLRPGTYYIYALKDESGAYRYNGKALFAFADSAVVVAPVTTPVTLYAFSKEDPAPVVTGNASGNGRKQEKRLKIQTNISGDKQSLMRKFSLLFEVPLRSFDSSKIYISTDTSFIPATNYSWSLDSTKKTLTLNNTWKPGTLYHIIVEKDFATDTLGQQLLKKDTLSFTTRGNSEYGQLTIRFRNLDLSKNPVLQLVQGSELKSSYPVTSESISLPMVEPGDYELRILNDTNKNGIWDPGDFFKGRKQPEIARPIGRKISVRADWKNQFEIAL